MDHAIMEILTRVPQAWKYVYLYGVDYPSCIVKIKFV